MKLVMRKQETGAIAAEHAILLALIAIAIITAVTLLGDEVQALFDTLLVLFPG